MQRVYAYRIARQSDLFRHEISSLGAHMLTASEDYWMASVVRIYAMARSSLLA